MNLISEMDITAARLAKAGMADYAKVVDVARARLAEVQAQGPLETGVESHPGGSPTLATPAPVTADHINPGTLLRYTASGEILTVGPFDGGLYALSNGTKISDAELDQSVMAGKIQVLSPGAAQTLDVAGKFIEEIDKAGHGTSAALLSLALADAIEADFKGDVEPRPPWFTPDLIAADFFNNDVEQGVLLLPEVLDKLTDLPAKYKKIVEPRLTWSDGKGGEVKSHYCCCKETDGVYSIWIFQPKTDQVNSILQECANSGIAAIRGGSKQGWACIEMEPYKEASGDGDGTQKEVPAGEAAKRSAAAELIAGPKDDKAEFKAKNDEFKRWKADASGRGASGYSATGAGQDQKWIAYKSDPDDNAKPGDQVMIGEWSWNGGAKWYPKPYPKAKGSSIHGAVARQADPIPAPSAPGGQGAPPGAGSRTPPPLQTFETNYGMGDPRTTLPQVSPARRENDVPDSHFQEPQGHGDASQVYIRRPDGGVYRLPLVVIQRALEQGYAHDLRRLIAMTASGVDIHIHVDPGGGVAVSPVGPANPSEPEGPLSTKVEKVEIVPDSSTLADLRAEISKTIDDVMAQHRTHGDFWTDGQMVLYVPAGNLWAFDDSPTFNRVIPPDMEGSVIAADLTERFFGDGLTDWTRREIPLKDWRGMKKLDRGEAEAYILNRMTEATVDGNLKRPDPGPAKIH